MQLPGPSPRKLKPHDPKRLFEQALLNNQLGAAEKSHDYDVLADLAYRRGLPVTAIELWEYSLGLREQQPEVHLKTGVTFHELGDRKRAHRHLQRAAEIDSAWESRVSKVNRLFEPAPIKPTAE